MNWICKPHRYVPVRRRVTVDNGAATFVNFTLSMRDLAKWSKKLDFDITQNLQTSYMNPQQIYDFLHSVSLKYPHDTRLTTFGKSQQGSSIYSLEVSSGLATSNRKVHIALIGAINGDEPVGTEVLVRFVRHLVEGECICGRGILACLRHSVAVSFPLCPCLQYFG